MTMRDGAMSTSAGMKRFSNLFFPSLAVIGLVYVFLIIKAKILSKRNSTIH